MVAFFFFFQAEDGIRDLTVTGVQTCALPIFLARCPRLSRGEVWRLRSCRSRPGTSWRRRSEEHTSELQSQSNLVCRLLLEKKNMKNIPVAVLARRALANGFQTRTTPRGRLMR